MRPDENQAAGTVDLLAGNASEGEVAGVHALAGDYRLVVEGVTAEVEFMETVTSRRFVLVARPGATVIAAIPQGRYRLWWRLPLAGDAGRAHLRLVRMGAIDRLAFYGRKLLSLVTRPGDIAGAGRRFFARRGGEAVGMAVSGATARATPSELSPRTERIERPAVTDIQRVSIIIPTRDRPDLLSACLRSLDGTEGMETDIIIVDNGSVLSETHVVFDRLAKQPNIRILRDDAPFNFARLSNLGAVAAGDGALLFLNDDVEALDGSWLKAMADYLSLPDVGVVGARLIYPSGDLQHAGIATNLLPGPGHPWRGLPENGWRHNPIVSRTGTVDAVTGACLLIRRSLFEAVGGFDAEAFGITLNDVDLCLKARARGLRVLCVAEATLVHKEGQTRRADDAPDQRNRRDLELAAFVARYPDAARHSLFYPPTLRRDTDTGAAI